MNKASVLCRNLGWFQARARRCWLGTPGTIRLCRATWQHTAVSPAVDVPEEGQNEIQRKYKSEVLRKLIQNGSIVRTALSQPIELNLENLNNVEEILDCTRDKLTNLTSFERNQILRAIKNKCLSGEMSEDDINEVCKDVRYLAILNSIDVQIESPLNLVLILENVLPLFKKETPFIYSVQDQLDENVRNLQFRVLARLLSVCSGNRESKQGKPFLNMVLTQVHKRWVEIDSPEQLFKVWDIVGTKPTKMRIKLQNKALDLTDQMSSEQLISLLSRLSKASQRNVPLVKNIFFHLLKSGIGNDFSDIQTILFAISNLNMYDEAIIRDTTTSLYSNFHILKKQEPESLNAVLFSLTKLKHKYVELIDGIVDIILPYPEDGTSEQDIVDKLSLKTLSGLILSCGSLNHVPKRWSEGKVLDISVKRLQHDLASDPTQWLNVVYSLVSLGLADESAVASVLVQEGLKEYANYTSYWKLRDIDFSAKHELKSYSGPHLTEAFVKKEEFSKTCGFSKRPILKSIVTALSKSFGDENHFITDYQHPSGLSVDIHMAVDSNKEPLEVKGSSPEGAFDSSKLVAVVPLEYSDMTKCSVGPNDIKSLHLRHLKLLGYNVVTIPYMEWKDLPSTMKQVKYIFDKIQ